MANNLTLDTIFRNGKTYGKWLAKEVTDQTLEELYELMKFAPTSANCNPFRLVFVKEGEAKQKLLATLSPGNVEKTKTAPVTAVCAYDTKFFEHLPMLFPHADFKSGYEANPARAVQAGSFNATLQIGYFILAARAVGLDCGPMAGFSKDKVDELFFSDGRYKSLMLCNLGYGDASENRQRDPRLSFKQVCSFK